MALVESGEEEDETYDVNGIKVVTNRRVLSTIAGDLTIDYIQSWGGKRFAVYDSGAYEGC